MPLNLLKKYNSLLDISGLNVANRKISLLNIFGRDITNNTSFKLRGKQITPTPKDGEITMGTIFTHLTTQIVDEKTRRREYDLHRSMRLHWLKYDIDNNDKVLCFTVKEPQGYRTYVYDKIEKYVIVLEPKHKNTIYYLLTAYHLRGRDGKRDKMMRKYKRRIEEVL
jgi:hypothetical protein